MDNQVKADLYALFEILDSTEESHEGRKFRPTEIHTCRVQHRIKLEEILPRLREYAITEVQCPDCEGEGTQRKIMNVDGPSEYRVDCESCDGSGLE